MASSGTVKELCLNSIRDSLIRQEDSIVFALIERAKFPLNSKAYVPSDLFGGLSFAEFFVREAEALQSKGGRYQNPEETPFFPDNLPSPLLPSPNYPQIFHPASASVCVNKDIWNKYINEFLPLFTSDGDDGNYAMSVACDLVCLQALSRRIHYGKHVAEVKFIDAPQDYSPLIRAQDKDALMELLTFAKVEEMVKKRVAKKALIFGQTVTLEDKTGSADECRCEGCKNTFGTKEGYEISEMAVEHRRLEPRGFERDLSIELESIDVKQQTTNTKQSHSRFSPVTPVPRSIIENDVPMPQISLCYSSETATPTVQIHEHPHTKSTAPSSVPHNHDTGFQTGKEIVEYSPTWDNISLSPFLKASPKIEGSSAISKSGESKSLQIRLLQEHGRIAYDHVSWRSSPMTPLHQFGERRLMQGHSSEVTLNSNHEDETPEILKETHEPHKSVKATSSPNQKRVSPPHLNANNTHTKSPSSSRGVRKFVLQSVPPFPKLTPYSKSNREDGT